MKKNTLVVASVCWMLLLAVVGTIFLTMRAMGVGPESLLMRRLGGADRPALDRYDRLDEVRQILASEFYHELDDDELVLGAIRGMMAATDDPYTYYSTPDELRQTLEHMSGNYEGIGLVLSMDQDHMLTVVRVFPDTPAALSDVRPGDRITKVNGADVGAETKQDMDDAIALIKTSEDPNISLTLLRGKELVEVKVTRGPISAARTAHRMLDSGVGYIAIYEFMGDDVPGFERALADLESQGMRALVVDVRNNPGGLLEDVVAIADLLLPEGLIVYTEDRAGHREEYFSDADCLGMPIAVLTNGMSASASEILAGALQDYGAGTVVGETTYGKGIVQESIPFRDGAGMQLTVATYYTPKGRSIHGEGVAPDVVVAQADGMDPTDAELNPEQDAQLAKAHELLRDRLTTQ